MRDKYTPPPQPPNPPQKKIPKPNQTKQKYRPRRLKPINKTKVEEQALVRRRDITLPTVANNG